MSDGKPAGAKKKAVAGILAIIPSTGMLGIHKFYLGYIKEGIISIILCGGLCGVIPFIEGLLYLTKSDEDFVATYITGKKGWFQMYKIIGADGREYGPVSVEQLRQWIAEGRANAQTRVQPEGTMDWKPLAETPEFAALYSVPPPIVPPIPAAPKASGADKKIPAGICGILLGGLGIHKFILGYTGEGVTMLLISILTCFIGYPIMHLFGIIEGIIYLTKPDDDFVATYATGKKGWF